MTAFDERLSGVVGAVCARCDKDGCALRDVPKAGWILLDGDRIAANERDRAPAGEGGRICDCLLISRSTPRRALVVELKSGRSEARRAGAQLQGCAERLQGLLEGEPVVAFYAVLLVGRVNSSAEMKVIGRVRIRFRGRSFPLLHQRCGTTLPDLLSSLDSAT